MYSLSSSLSNQTTPALCADVYVCCPALVFGCCWGVGRGCALLRFSRNSLGITLFQISLQLPSRKQEWATRGCLQCNNNVILESARLSMFVTVSLSLPCLSLFQNNADQVAFQVGGGLTALEQILQVVTAASSPTAVPRIPLKWVLTWRCTGSPSHSVTFFYWDVFKCL